MSTARINDHDGLLALLRAVKGRIIVGVVDGGDCLELVLSGKDGNLLSFYVEGQHTGTVALGYIAPELVEDGYGQDEP